MAVINLSFAACGFLGIYQLGAVDALLTHGHRLLSCLRACAGASAGALVAAVLITAPDKLEVKLTTAAIRNKTTTVTAVTAMTTTIKAAARTTTAVTVINKYGYKSSHSYGNVDDSDKKKNRQQQ